MARKPVVYSPPPAGAVAVTIPELAFLARCKRDKVYAEINAGKLTPIKVGKRTLFTMSAVREYLSGLGLEAPNAHA